MRGGSVLIDNIRKAALQPYAHRLEEFLGLDTYTMARVVAKMKQLGMAPLMTRGLNYKLALELLGFKVQTGANKGLTVTGKRARTPAPRPKWRLMPCNLLHLNLLPLNLLLLSLLLVPDGPPTPSDLLSLLLLLVPDGPPMLSALFLLSQPAVSRLSS